ncbi:MAG: NAD(P)/FAD-dependent oxidoreductase [Alphaproteobacteria bacterium]|nr:NAD(P)/FAD-dependent oxidoreductase [Alphaproteobacteria bacterium]
MQTERVDAVVIGAGVVGLAVARALARARREVIVLEAADAIGTETSSRNSEVIHAGIYYPTGSLKAGTCVAGRDALYRYCATHGVPHRRCGKIIVATDEGQAGELAAIARRAEANGAGALVPLTPEEVAAREPEVRCVAALWSPLTGIVDSHALMLAYQGDLEEAGGSIAFLAPVAGGAVGGDGVVLETGGDDAMRLACGLVVNCAGLHAQRVAAALAGFSPGKVPGTWYAKGNYYTLAARAPFSHLVYPVPEPGGLGVHVTLDMAGQARFGPDVEWIEGIDYTVDPRRADRFYAAVRRYWPGLPDGALQPGYSGIRPKLGPQGAPAGDFVVQGPADHGIPGLVNFFGIESPGLTASLPLARLACAALGVDPGPED